MANGYSELPNQLVSAANGVDYACRDTGGGEGAVPLVLLQHFRGNLDNWDPALVDALAQTRRVVTFDNAGVGGSTGTTADTIEQMARDAIEFLAALELSQADLLGFSIGSFVAQQIALVRPAIVRRLVLASSAPQGAAGMHGWAPEVIGAIGTPQTSPEAYLDVFFTQSAASRQAGQEALKRMYARTQDRDTATTWATREAQYDAVCTWGIPHHALLQRLSAIGNAGVRGERRQRPDDPAALLLPARRPDPARPGEDLSRRGARVLVPASRRVRRRREHLPHPRAR
jgi:pimeloyl-ACP methyl ester carboxylesterase